jgi:hypothetical protein
MNSESDVMGLQHQLQQKEANLVALKREVSTCYPFNKLHHCVSWGLSFCCHT